MKDWTVKGVIAEWILSQQIVARLNPIEPKLFVEKKWVKQMYANDMDLHILYNT